MKWFLTKSRIYTWSMLPILLTTHSLQKKSYFTKSWRWLMTISLIKCSKMCSYPRCYPCQQVKLTKYWKIHISCRQIMQLTKLFKKTLQAKRIQKQEHRRCSKLCKSHLRFSSKKNFHITSRELGSSLCWKHFCRQFRIVSYFTSQLSVLDGAAKESDLIDELMRQI